MAGDELADGDLRRTPANQRPVCRRSFRKLRGRGAPRERHTENARQVAHFLRADPRVAWVDYSGFPDSPYYGLTRKYLGGRAPSLFTFGVTGDLEAGKAFYDSLKLIKRLVNIGDTRTLCCHPASTTHRQMTAEEQLRAGVSPETIRLSVGIEHAQDIIEDLDQALSGASPAASRVVSR